EGLQVPAVEPIDVDVGADLDARSPQMSQSRDARVEAPLQVAHQVVRLTRAVQADGHATNASCGHVPSQLCVDAAAAGGHDHLNAVPRQAPSDVEEALVQVGLAADEHHLARAESGQLVGDGQRLLHGELVLARRARPRAAVRAGVIAAQRQLPDDVSRLKRRVHDVETTALARSTLGPVNRTHVLNPSACPTTRPPAPARLGSAARAGPHHPPGPVLARETHTACRSKRCDSWLRGVSPAEAGQSTEATEPVVTSMSASRLTASRLTASRLTAT